MGIGNRIKEARENLGMTQTELGEKVGVTGSAITNYEKNTSHPKESIICKLMDVLQVDANYLFQDMINLKKDQTNISLEEYNIIEIYRLLDAKGKDFTKKIMEFEAERLKQIKIAKNQIELLKSSTPSTAQNSPGNIIMRTYPYFHKIACAGEGFYFDDIPVDTIEAPLLDGADFVIGVNGDSMEPDYSDGDIVYVRKATELKQGDVGIFTIGNECFIKELGADRLISRNRSYEDIKGNEDVRLIGKVIGKV